MHGTIAPGAGLKLAEDRAQAPRAVAHHLQTQGLGAHDDAHEVAAGVVRLEEGERERLELLLERRARDVFHPHVERRHELGLARHEELAKELLPIDEIVVDGPDRDAGAPRDRDEVGAFEAFFDDRALGGLEDRIANRDA